MIRCLEKGVAGTRSWAHLLQTRPSSQGRWGRRRGKEGTRKAGLGQERRSVWGSPNPQPWRLPVQGHRRYQKALPGLVLQQSLHSFASPGLPEHLFSSDLPPSSDHSGPIANSYPSSTQLLGTLAPCQLCLGRLADQTTRYLVFPFAELQGRQDLKSWVWWRRTRRRGCPASPCSSASSPSPRSGPSTRPSRSSSGSTWTSSGPWRRTSGAPSAPSAPSSPRSARSVRPDTAVSSPYFPPACS